MRKNIRDITGHQFGLLTALTPTGEMKWGVSLWKCSCTCGKEHIAAVNSLKQGLVRSCGCLRSVAAKARADYHGRRQTGAYISWDAMTQRCLNKNSESYARYGALGVTVCERWRFFKLFLEDMGERPEGTTLDRINASGNYEPGNCRWASLLVQARNRRKPTTTWEQAEQVRLLYSQGKFPAEIARLLGITKGSVSGIVYLGQVSNPTSDS